MKVNGDQTASRLDAYLKQFQSNRAQNIDNQNKTSMQGSVDQVELSQKAIAMQQAAHVLNNAESEIVQRVDQVKTEIDKGTYVVDAPKVATDMLKESFENEQVFNRIDLFA